MATLGACADSELRDAKMELDPGHIALIYRRTFRVTVETASHHGPPEQWSGTAFCFAMWRDSRRPVLATARHVLDFRCGTDVVMRFERFDDEDRLINTVTVRSQSDAADRPFGFYKHSDIGFIHLPADDDSGSRLFADDEDPLRVLPDDRRLTAGSWVAWAGFAGQVEHFLEHSQLCLFQGTVSAFGRRADRAGHAYYIVDGHAAPGVSGGPVWETHPTDGLQVAGIVSSLRADPPSAGPAIPGFCCFEPLNPLVAYAKTNFLGR